MFDVGCTVLIAVLGALLTVLSLRSKPRRGWFRYAVVVVAVFQTTVSAIQVCRHREQSERQSTAMHDEIIRTENSRGKILPPTIAPQADLMELTLGTNTVKCPAAYQLDLAQVLNGLTSAFPPAAEGPYLRVVSRTGQLYVSATLTDKNGQLLGILHDNEFVFTPSSDLYQV